MYRDDEDVFADQVRRDYEAHLTAYLITRSTRRWAVIVAIAFIALVAWAKVTGNSADF
jgi:hypothetical protein